MLRLSPSPASFQDTTRFSPLRAALALRKCGLAARAAWAARPAISIVMIRSVTRPPDLPSRACLCLRCICTVPSFAICPNALL